MAWKEDSRHTFLEITPDSRFLFSLFLCFSFWKKCLDGSFRLFHGKALELYHNFSFAAQLYSIFMLLNDAALSVREWHFRAVSAVKGNLRQIKLLVGFFLRGGVVLGLGFFFLGRGEEESSPRAAFVFEAQLELWPIESFMRKKKKKITQVLCLNEGARLKCSSLQSCYLWIIIKRRGSPPLFSQSAPSEVFPPMLLDLLTNKWLGLE